MSKGILLTIHFLGWILLTVFQGGINVNYQVPQAVVAGDEFEVSLELNKGDLSSFSRLQQNLPAGLTATPIESSQADFSFKDRTIRHIWLKMPSEPTITLRYKVKVNERLKGTFSIEGQFSYIEDNERRSVNLLSTPITIEPSPDVDPDLIVSLADYEKLITPYTTASIEDPQIACIRQTPIVGADQKSYIVNLLVSKERKEKFAKVEEIVPKGYRAEAIETHGAIFTFKDQKAKFLWMSLPASTFFTVSYRLVPVNGKNVDPRLNGKFSYLENEKSVSINILQTNQQVASISSREELFGLLTSLTNEEEPVATTELIAENATPTEGKEKPEGRIKPLITSLSNKKYLLEPENGVYYRVQLAAGHKQVNVKRYFEKYKFDKQVKMEYHDGWHKYSLGSFGIYKDARDYRIYIWNTTDIDDAFVSAYNNGERITVQEALMITNHQWYR